MDGDLIEVVLTQEEIATRVAELGAQISLDYEGKYPLMISVLKGSVVFMSDLMRSISIDVSIDFMSASSYGTGTASAGSVKILKDLDIPLNNRHVLVVEDILDSGRTLSYILELLKVRNPASLRICALLDKPERREVEIRADYTGFVIPNKFIVGYGLDYAEKYRNLPAIYVLDPAVYAPEDKNSV
ncbi:MAG: hypoxanthine phosphoribosyltransferase [Oscillospiraceae bacterium]|jgi:hypoxanthine phosphoribosyltransferase|nr:hypoxanthine phosphoribosyltransferase [Oscillospiraceae bacterium]